MAVRPNAQPFFPTEETDGLRLGWVPVLKPPEAEAPSQLVEMSTSPGSAARASLDGKRFADLDLGRKMDDLCKTRLDHWMLLVHHGASHLYLNRGA